VFAAIADENYLRWEPSIGKLERLPKQPPARYVSTIDEYTDAEQGLASLAIDPTRGQLLGQLIQSPTLRERVEQGGLVGYVIIGLGVLAVIIGLIRLVILSVTNRKVATQEKRTEASGGNPLGRVLQAYQRNRSADVETLELKLDEAVLREVVRLERLHWLIKVVSVVAPLLGLLGTVTGMIRTFQAITLYGTGDPRMMAGGISEALVTTMLGLIIAIPLVLMHALLSSSSRRVIDVLAQQSAGLVAEHAERSRVGV
jgi:biopolymer transport protein ExbB